MKPVETKAQRIKRKWGAAPVAVSPSVNGVNGRIYRRAPIQSISRARTVSSTVMHCPYRGEQIRLETCHSCQGNVQVKVFKCGRHGECTIGKAVDGIHVCTGGIERLPYSPEYLAEQEAVKDQNK